MGFYIELEQTEKGKEFRELGTPPVFWFLYGFAGFALACMGGAAYSVLGDLAAKGSLFDRTLVWLILGSIPAYFLVGLKLAGVRKFVGHEGSTLRLGYRLFGRAWLMKRETPRDHIRSVELLQRKPSANVAPAYHNDQQYHIRGHWRLVAFLNDGSTMTLDKHTEKEALGPLHQYVDAWMKA